VSVSYDWDPAKAASNLKRHGVSFEEAADAFTDPHALLAADILDPRRTLMIAFGVSRGQLLAVVFTEPSPDLIRIISARRATKAERKHYEKNDQ
jgi:uncharacterized protein